jgi:hypothetical protein
MTSDIKIASNSAMDPYPVVMKNEKAMKIPTAARTRNKT